MLAWNFSTVTVLRKRVFPQSPSVWKKENLPQLQITVRVIPGKQFCTLCEGAKPGKIKELCIHTGLYKYALIQISVGKVKYSSLVLAVSFNCGRNEAWQ